ncbi:MAG: Spectrin alpha chain, non-erythrocytic 1 [Paramarteilia canceri]
MQGPNNKIEILNECKKVFGEIDYFVSKNENLLVHMEDKKLINPSISNSLENSIHKMKEKIELYESEIHALKDNINSLQNISKQSLITKFDACEKVLENFKVVVTFKEKKLSTLNSANKIQTKEKIYESKLKWINKSLKKIKEELNKKTIESSSKTLDLVREALDDCLNYQKNLNKSEEEVKTSMDELVGLEDSAKSLENSIKSLTSTHKCLNESKNFKNSTDILFKKLKNAEKATNVIETEASLRRLKVFETEFTQRLNQVSPSISYITNILKENDLDIISTAQKDVEEFEKYCNEIKQFIFEKAKFLTTKIQIFKFLTQSSSLIKYITNSTESIINIKPNKIQKYAHGYTSYCSSYENIKEFYTQRFSELIKLYDIINVESIDQEITDELKEKKIELESSFINFESKTKSFSSAISSQISNSNILDNIAYLEHLIEVKTNVGEWMLKCSYDDQAYYADKLSTEIKELKLKKQDLDKELEDLKKDEHFDCLIDPLQQKLDNIDEMIQKFGERFETFAAQYITSDAENIFEVDLEFISLWMKAFEETMNESNPKLVSYTWQIGNKCFEKELTHIQKYLNDIIDRIHTEYSKKEFPKNIKESLESVNDNFAKISNLVNSLLPPSYYDFFLEIKSLQLKYRALDIDIPIISDLDSESLTSCLNFNNLILGIFENENEHFESIISKYSNLGSIPPQYFSMVSEEYESLVRLNFKIKGKIAMYSTLLRDIKNFFDTKLKLDLFDSKIYLFKHILENKRQILATIEVETTIVEFESIDLCKIGSKIDELNEEISKEYLKLSHIRIKKWPYHQEKELKVFLKSGITKVVNGFEINIPTNSTGILLDENEGKSTVYIHNIGIIIINSNELVPNDIKMSLISKLDPFNLGDTLESIQCSINSLRTEHQNLHKLYNDSISIHKAREDLFKVSHWLELATCSTLFEKDVNTIAHIDEYQKALLSFSNIFSDKVLFFKSLSEKLDSNTVTEQIRETCENNINHLKSMFDDQFKQIGPSFKITSICNDLEQYNQWFDNLIIRLNSKESDWSEISFEYEILKDAFDKQSAKIESLPQLQDSENSLNNVMSKLLNLFNDCKSKKMNLETKMNASLAQKDKNEMEKRAKMIEIEIVDITEWIESVSENNDNKISENLLEGDLKPEQLSPIILNGLAKAKVTRYNEAKETLKNCLNQFPDSSYTTMRDFIDGSEQKVDKFDIMIKKYIQMLDNRSNLEEKYKNLKIMEQNLESLQKKLSHDPIKTKIDKKTNIKDEILLSKNNKKVIDAAKKFVDNENKNLKELKQTFEGMESDNQIKTMITDLDSISKKVIIQINEVDKKCSEKIIEFENASSKQEVLNLFKEIEQIAQKVKSNVKNVESLDLSQKSNFKRLSSITLSNNELKYAKDLMEKSQKLIDDIFEHYEADYSSQAFYNEKYDSLKIQLQECEKQVEDQTKLTFTWDIFNSKCDEASNYISWLDDKQANILAKLVSTGDDYKTFDIQAIVEIFQLSKQDIEDTKQYFSACNDSNSDFIRDKKLTKIAEENHKKLNESLSRFETALGDIQSFQKLEDTLQKWVKKIDEFRSLGQGFKLVKDDFLNAKVNSTHNFTEISANLSRLDKYRAILASHLDDLEKLSQLVNSKSNNKKVAKIHKLKMEEIQSSIRRLEKDLSSTHSAFEAEIRKLNFYKDCLQTKELLSFHLALLTDNYALMLNKFSNLANVIHPDEPSIQIEIEFKPLSHAVEMVISQKMVDFRNKIQTYGFIDQDTYLQVNDMEKKLSNMLNCYNQDINRFSQKFISSLQLSSNLSLDELNYIKISAKFTSLIDFCELQLTQPLFMLAADSIKLYTDIIKTVEEKLKEAESLLDTLNGINIKLKDVDHSLIMPICYSDLEMQFMECQNLKEKISVDLLEIENRMSSLKEVETLYLSESSSLDQKLKQINQDLVRTVLKPLDSDTHTKKLLKTFTITLASMQNEIYQLSELWKQYTMMIKDISEVVEVCELEFKIPNELSMKAIQTKYNHTSQLNKEISAQLFSNASKNKVETKEATMIFKHFDESNSGYIKTIHLQSCLESIGLTGSILNSVNSKNDPNGSYYTMILEELDPKKTGKIFLEDFLKFVKNKLSQEFRSAVDVLDAFKAMSTSTEYDTIMEDDLKMNLSAECANYWIAKMKNDPAAVLNDGVYNYAKLFSV